MFEKQYSLAGKRAARIPRETRKSRAFAACFSSGNRMRGGSFAEAKSSATQAVKTVSAPSDRPLAEKGFLRPVTGAARAAQREAYSRFSRKRSQSKE